MDAIKLLKGLMGNKSLSSALGSQLLGGMLGGGGQQQQSSSPLAGILSGMLGGGQQSGGGSLMSGLLGSMLGGGNSGGGSGASGIAGLVGGMLGGGQEAEPAPAPASDSQLSHHDQAILMIRAMVNAAKSDGRIDEQEQENIISKLGEEVSQGEIEFLRQEFAAPLDATAFAKTVPSGMEQTIYAISLTSIELDTQNEANYLGELAQGLNMDPNTCNQIHDHLGAPQIFG